MIQVTGDQIVLANDVGCKLVIKSRDGKYGLGTLYLNEVALGTPVDRFLNEVSLGNNAQDPYQRIWPGKWEPGFQPVNTRSWRTAPIRSDQVFRQRREDHRIRDNHSAPRRRGLPPRFEFLPRHSVKHALYVSAPFFTDKSNCSVSVRKPSDRAVSRPLEHSAGTEHGASDVRLESIDGHDYYVGIGYRLDQEYARGRIEYDTAEAAPFKLQFILPHPSAGSAGLTSRQIQNPKHTG